MPQHIGIFPATESTGLRVALSVNVAGSARVSHGVPAVVRSVTGASVPAPSGAPFTVSGEK